MIRITILATAADEEPQPIDSNFHKKRYRWLVSKEAARLARCKELQHGVKANSVMALDESTTCTISRGTVTRKAKELSDMLYQIGGGDLANTKAILEKFNQRNQIENLTDRSQMEQSHSHDACLVGFEVLLVIYIPNLTSVLLASSKNLCFSSRYIS